MKPGVLFVLGCLAITLPAASGAETVVAARVIKARAIVTAEDLKLSPDIIPGGFSDPRLIIGYETRVAVYAGQPIRAEDIAPPAVIERNQRVTVAYRKGGLTILAEGRALGRGGVGETIRVMNSDSKMTVDATIGDDGLAYVNSR